MTYEDGPRTERIKIFIIVVDPHNIGIQMKRKELDICGDYKLKKKYSAWFKQK